MNAPDDRLTLWSVELPRAALSTAEADYLAGLPPTLPTVEWVSAELDRVWNELGLDNTRPLTGQPIAEFYRHPVWLMNGVFTATDPVSVDHRTSIARYVAKLKPVTVADFGGGFGELARIIHAETRGQVSIVEPYPTGVARHRVAQIEGVEFVPHLSERAFDVVVAQDVLEHVEKPVDLAAQLAAGVRPGGFVIFANHFEPAIACHLPRTFHLRHTFPFVMRALGLRYQGTVDGAEHAEVFIVPNRLHLRRARRAERASKVTAPVLERIGGTLPRGFMRRARARLLRPRTRP